MNQKVEQVEKAATNSRESISAAALSEFYQRKLLEPGWAGQLSREEFVYIKSKLEQSPSLRRRWGFRQSARRLPERVIRAVARDGLTANGKRVLASVVRGERPGKTDSLGANTDHLPADTKTRP